MPHESILVQKRPPTGFTREWSIIVMFVHMTLKIYFMMASFSTDITTEFVEAFMRTSMLMHFSGCLERHWT